MQFPGSKADWKPAASKYWPLVLGVGLSAWMVLHQTPAVQIPAKTQRTIDSMFVTRPLDSALVDSLKRVSAQRVRAAQAAKLEASRDSARADSAEHVADSLAHVARQATGSDTAGVAWHRAYAAESAVVVSQRSELRNKNITIAALESDTTTKASIIRLRELRLVAAEDLNTRLAKDFAQANDCYILPFVRCPTRKATAVGTALVATITTLVVIKR